jgi:polar amino acid transport system permease protein
VIAVSSVEDAAASRLPSPDVSGRATTLGVGAVFWAWLLARWINDYLLPASVALPSDQPFVPVEAVEWATDSATAAVSTLAAVGDDGGVIAVAFDLSAGVLRVTLVETARFAVRTVPSMPALAQGAWVTVVLTVTSIALGFLLAVPLSVTRVYGSRPLQWLSLGYTELLRGTPLLAQLFVLHFGTPLSVWVRQLPAVGQGYVPDQAVWIAVVGFTYVAMAAITVWPRDRQATGEMYDRDKEGDWKP